MMISILGLGKERPDTLIAQFNLAAIMANKPANLSETQHYLRELDSRLRNFHFSV